RLERGASPSSDRTPRSAHWRTGHRRSRSRNPRALAVKEYGPSRRLLRAQLSGHNAHFDRGQRTTGPTAGDGHAIAGLDDIGQLSPTVPVEEVRGSRSLPDNTGRRVGPEHYDLVVADLERQRRRGDRLHCAVDRVKPGTCSVGPLRAGDGYPDGQ